MRRLQIQSNTTPSLIFHWSVEIVHCTDNVMPQAAIKNGLLSEKKKNYITK